MSEENQKRLTSIGRWLRDLSALPWRLKGPLLGSIAILLGAVLILAWLVLSTDNRAGSPTSPTGQALATRTAETMEVTTTAEARPSSVEVAATAEALAPAQTATAQAAHQQSTGLSRDNPVPFGQPYTLPEGWEITVLDFVADATASILEENSVLGVTPPGEGETWVIVRLRGTNISAGDPANFEPRASFRLVGSSNITRKDCSANFVPGSFNDNRAQAFINGTVEGNICFEVEAAESDFVLFTELSSFSPDNRRFFDVQP